MRTSRHTPPLTPFLPCPASAILTCDLLFSFAGYRSPSPMLRPSAAWTNQESSAYEPAPPPQRPPPVLSRQSSRFERPAPPSIEDKQKQARVRREEEYESYVPMDSVPQRRGREFELTSPQMEGENEAKRRRIEDRPSVRPGSQFPGLPARPVEEELPLRKRVPLPPQSERFREAATGRPVAPPQSPVGVYPESGPAHAGGGGGIARRPSINVGVPSGPRNHPPPSVPLRNVNHPDFAQGRLPPSGPSAAATRTRPSRFQSDVPPMQSVDRDAMEVDIPPASRAVAMNRAGPSAYDRDPQETLPKGPRAMAHRLSTGGYPVAHAAAAPPPTIMYPPRQTVQQEMLPPRLRDRSPPPHMARGDTRGLYPTAVNAERPSRFERTADVVPRDGPLQEITELRKGQIIQAAPDFLNGPRQSEAKQPHIMTGQKPKLSGTNSVPIANMRTFGSAPAAPLVPNSSTLADRYPVRMDVDREPPSRSRYPNNQEQDIAPYERGREVCRQISLTLVAEPCGW
ncbi:hypothetical protein OE88DRAFT_403916 [Heliocybe sulcata]|uniref:Uncharacterized protein n=1 Tax=Heliocybe sulcata TaxID=5364 RepID=A0A5C3MVT5_9AGAM|nr:hypothetical protein OE88DRAFT_403916 [Heliocybe sulcata]